MGESEDCENGGEFLDSLLRHDLRNKAQIIQGWYEILDESQLSGEQKEYIEEIKDCTSEFMDFDGVQDAVNYGFEDALDEIKGYHSKIMESDLSGESRKFLEKAEASIKSCFDLYENVLNLEKMADGEMELKTYDVDGMFEDILEGYDQENSGMELRYEESGQSVYGVPILPEAFCNIVNNSVKHSGGDQIEIYSEEEDDKVRIIVQDDGRGIPEGRRKEIFEKGAKGEGSSGSGLGMYLVREIVEASEGSVEAKESDSKGAGFDVTLNKA